MSEISAERKLQIVKQIREEHANNQRLIRGRENILYGFHSPYPAYQNEMHQAADLDSETFPLKGNLSFRIRLVVSLILLVSVILLDKTNTDIFQYTVSDMFTYLGTDLTKDFQVNLFDFTSDIPYTTK